MSTYVIGIVRTAKCLHRLVYETRESTDRTHPWLGDHVCALRPLPPNSRTELWTAWRALESVGRWDEATLAHVLTILRMTVPDADFPSDLPPLGLDVHGPAEPVATAAHPRAYRGTKYRPPRPQQPAAVDLRPYLLTRRDTEAVMALLGQAGGSDPYLAWNHGGSGSARLDPAFITNLLPLFRDCTWSQVGEFASIARTLELSVRADLRAALVGVYLSAGDPIRALAWWGHVLAHDSERWLETAKLVCASGIAKLPPLDPAFAAEVGQLSPVQQWSIFRGLVGGASPAYLSSGLRFGSISSSKIEDLAPGQVDVSLIVEATTERLAKALAGDSGTEFWRGFLWELCGHQPELIELLSSTEFMGLRPEAAYWVLRLAAFARWEANAENDRWRELAPNLRHTVELATRVLPAYQRKFIEDMGNVYEWSITNDRDLSEAHTRCVDLCFRVAKPPFDTTAIIGSLLPSMALILADRVHEPERQAIRDAPESCWRALEQACRRENRLRVVRRGLNRLSQRAPKLLAETFPTAPGALLRTADSLASVSFEIARDLIDSYRKSALADSSLTAAPIEQLCRLIEPESKAGGPNPIRRALRSHLAGERVLSERQLRGHRERLVTALGIVRLATIRQSVDRVIAGRIGIEKIEMPRMRHALTMLNEVDVHRRQLRRLLHATLAGDLEWRLRHPLTKAWFAHHAHLKQTLWLEGIATLGVIPGIGEVRLAVEKDPLEALKLGTYVGSCLGRGGGLEYSAVAAVLDANKQVIYARDARGSVVGRQLIAISEWDQLVCFSVYGTAKLEALQTLFADYDREFAARLGLPLFGDSGSDDSYEIASILSHDWWDDGAWDFAS